MNKFFSAILLSAVLMAGAARSEDQIAFVDLKEVFKQFYKTQLAQDQIRQQADDIKMERDEIEAEVSVMKEEIEGLRSDSRDASFSEDVRRNTRDQLEERLVDLQKKEKEMIEFENLRQQQLAQQNKRMTKKLFDEIHESIITFAKLKSFTAVIDRSSKNSVGTDLILYTSSKADITADVIAVLNEGRESTQTDKRELSGEQPKSKE